MTDSGLAIENDLIVATTNDLAGFRIVRVLGVARGVTVRSRNLIAGFGAFLQTVRGGEITIYTRLAEDARKEAHLLLIADARRLGANAVLAMRYDANEINAGVTEVLAYGTAAIVRPIPTASAARIEHQHPEFT